MDGPDQLVVCECGHPFLAVAQMICVELFGSCPECGSWDNLPFIDDPSVILPDPPF